MQARCWSLYSGSFEQPVRNVAASKHRLSIRISQLLARTINQSLLDQYGGAEQMPRPKSPIVRRYCIIGQGFDLVQVDQPNGG
jgi:hypothetical protein